MFPSGLRARAALLTLVVSAGLLSALRAQAPAPPSPPQRPTFRADVNAVQLDLRVEDRSGAFVADLGRGDFRVFEDGVEQTITTFSLVNIPIEPPRLPEPGGLRADADIASNTNQDGRLYVIVLDDLEGQAHPQRSATVRALAREFIERNLTDVDRAALVTTSGRRDMAQDFTGNRQRLLESVSRFEGGYGAMQSTRTATGMSFDASGGALVSDNLRQTMLSLTSLADWLAKIDGRRKSILMISERLGRSMTGGIDSTLAAGEAGDVRDFVQAAARGNVTLYTVDPVGVPTGAATDIRPPLIDDGPPDGNAAFDQDRVQSLVTLAEATGGFAAVRSNDFRGAFRRVVEESSSYYLLGYVSSNQRRDGRYRDIDVRLSRPGLRVQARSGYIAPREAVAAAAPRPSVLPPALAEMLQKPLSISGLPLQVTAPVFRGIKDVGSSRVDLQACKLEYSIVSPK